MDINVSKKKAGGLVGAAGSAGFINGTAIAVSAHRLPPT